MKTYALATAIAVSVLAAISIPAYAGKAHTSIHLGFGNLNSHFSHGYGGYYGNPTNYNHGYRYRPRGYGYSTHYSGNRHYYKLGPGYRNQGHRTRGQGYGNYGHYNNGYGYYDGYQHGYRNNGYRKGYYNNYKYLDHGQSGHTGASVNLHSYRK